MVLIALSIIVLVLCSRYKQEPMTNSRTGITVTTIITAVITFFELTGVVALGVMNVIFGGDAFRQMLYDAIASGELDLRILQRQMKRWILLFPLLMRYL